MGGRISCSSDLVPQGLAEPGSVSFEEQKRGNLVCVCGGGGDGGITGLP